MSEQRPKASALLEGVDDVRLDGRARADERSKTQTTFTRGTPRPDVDFLFDMEDEDPESAGSSATAHASIALGATPPPPPLESSPRAVEDPDIWDDETRAAQRESLVGARPPMPSTFEFEPEVEEPLPSGSNLPRGTLPPAMRGIGTPAPPMAVPTLRPPAATPPPIRHSSPPPAPPTPQSAPRRGRQKVPPAAPPPTAPPQTRQSVPPLPDAGRVNAKTTPGPLLRAATSHSRSSKFASERPAPPAVATAPPAAQTLPGLAPPAESASTPPPSERPAGSPAVDAVTAPPTPNILPTQADSAPQSPTPLGEITHRGKPQRTWLVAGVVALLAVLIVLVVSRDPPPGALIVTVSAAQGGAVPKLEVVVDGQTRCTYSPCRVEGLGRGPHAVHASAPGYVNSERQALEVHSGTDTIHNLTLAETPKEASLEVSAEGSGITIFVDGKPQGPSPVTLAELTPGEHTIRIEGERFEPLDETVVLHAGESRKIGPLRPKVRLGSLTVEPGTDSDGANVRLDGRTLRNLPVTVDLDASKTHELTATKEGFDRFEHVVTFPDGKAETTAYVALVEAYAESEKDDAEDEHTQSAKRRTSGSTMATLSMNSIPPAKILLDGKPIGQTPRIGLSTKPGVHSVTFVHPERGRKTVRVTLAPGQKRTISVRF